jgi:DNA-binding NarL/FixJ family response regulator
MSTSISRALTAPVAEASSASTVAARAPEPTANATEDKVRLTEAQQVYQMHNQGKPVSQIAASLNLPVSAVNLYLGVTGG